MLFVGRDEVITMKYFKEINTGEVFVYDQEQILHCLHQTKSLFQNFEFYRFRQENSVIFSRCEVHIVNVDK